MEGNEVDKLDMVAYRRARGERKVLIERKSHVFCYVVQTQHKTPYFLRWTTGGEYPTKCSF